MFHLTGVAREINSFLTKIPNSAFFTSPVLLENSAAAPLAPIHSTEGRGLGFALDEVVVDGPKTTAWERRFNPYDFNGGYVQTPTLLFLLHLF